MDPLRDPDYTLIVRAQDLGGDSDKALSGNARVQIVVQENLWVNPGPVTVKENLLGAYPMVIARVSLNAHLGSDRSRPERHTPAPLSTRFSPTSRKPSTH